MADKYWVGGSATWDGTAGSKWSLSAGGAGGAAVPATGETVYFDGYTTSGQTVTLGTSPTCGQIIFTHATYGDFPGTFNWGANVITLDAAAGAAQFVNGMTISNIGGSSTLTFTGAGTSPLTPPSGKTLPKLTINGASTLVQLQGNTIVTNLGGVTITNGGIDLNDYNLTTGTFIAGNNANTRSVDFGTGTLTITTNSSTTLDLRKSSGTLTLTNLENCTIKFVPYSFPAYTTHYDDQTRTYGTVVVNDTSGGFVDITLAGGLTFTNMTIKGPTLVRPGGNYTFTNAPTINGSKTAPIMILTNTTSARTFTCNSNVNVDWGVVAGITKGGSGTFTATNSFDGGNNTNWTITPPGGSYVIGS